METKDGDVQSSLVQLGCAQMLPVNKCVLSEGLDHKHEILRNWKDRSSELPEEESG